MESIVDKIRSRIDLLNTLYPHERGRYYVDHEYGGYKLFFATAYSEEKCLSARMKPTECIRMLDVLIQVAEHEADCRGDCGVEECADKLQDLVFNLRVELARVKRDSDHIDEQKN